MKEKTIRVLKVAPKELPVVVYLTNELSALQDAVEGLIEIIEIDGKTCLLCNEEGKLNGMEPNRRFGSDVLCGTFYVTGQDKHGNLASLSQKNIQTYTAMFHEIEDISREEAEQAMFMRFFTW
jgi:hypothetical protein